MFLSQITECALARWSPGIGDPGFLGWLTVAGYLAAAGVSLRLGVTRGRGAVERIFWAVSGGGLLFLAVNKQLDLQSLLTAAGRCAALRQGWYETRSAVQVEFMMILAAASVIGGMGALWALRGTLRRTGIALLGLVWITGFVLVRAASFHHIDRLIGLSIAGMRLNWVFEFGGIAVFLIGCALAIARPERTRSDA